MTTKVIIVQVEADGRYYIDIQAKVGQDEEARVKNEQEKRRTKFAKSTDGQQSRQRDKSDQVGKEGETKTREGKAKGHRPMLMPLLCWAKTQSVNQDRDGVGALGFGSEHACLRWVRVCGNGGTAA